MLYRVPPSWEVPALQVKAIETLMEFTGKYVSTQDLVKWLYDEDIDPEAPAPPKLRVLMQRVRDTLYGLAGPSVLIATKRNLGYRITKSHARALIEMS